MNGFLTLYIEIFDQPHLDAALKELERLNIPVTYTTQLPPVRCIAIYVAGEDVRAALYSAGIVDKYEALQRSDCEVIKLRQLRRYFDEPVKVVHANAGDVGVSRCDSLDDGIKSQEQYVKPVESYTYSQRVMRKLTAWVVGVIQYLRGLK